MLTNILYRISFLLHRNGELQTTPKYSTYLWRRLESSPSPRCPPAGLSCTRWGRPWPWRPASWGWRGSSWCWAHSCTITVSPSYAESGLGLSSTCTTNRSEHLSLAPLTTSHWDDISRNIHCLELSLLPDLAFYLGLYLLVIFHWSATSISEDNLWVAKSRINPS